MSTRVYLSKHTCQPTPEEDTPVCIRIQLSRATVKELHCRLQHAYQRDDVRLVRRTTVLLDLLVHHVPVEVLGERWGLSPSCLYHWRQAFLLRGMDSLVYHHSGGRRPKLTLRQKKRLLDCRAHPGADLAGVRRALQLPVRLYVAAQLSGLSIKFLNVLIVSFHLGPCIGLCKSPMHRFTVML